MTVTAAACLAAWRAGLRLLAAASVTMDDAMHPPLVDTATTTAA